MQMLRLEDRVGRRTRSTRKMFPPYRTRLVNGYAKDLRSFWKSESALRLKIVE